ncbi:MAG: hypothetical protein A3E25_16020 [Burkholderiales bacterium RIFCSPHIGHO2_12_FULL_69_20]|nr:MAG: hypothetical protein A3E25_16020 [Burkholderiales bacterium RIFCSPHIGHO2_12_FULL_69_20]
MNKVAHHTNNLIGALLVSVVFLVLVLAIDRSQPNAATPYVAGFFILTGLASLGAWMWLSYRQLVR